MDLIERKKILQRLITRVSTGLSFIEDNYLSKHHGPDAAWIRNAFILLSFYSELLFKAIYVNEGQFSSLEELGRKLKAQGHNLERVGKDVGSSILDKYGVSSIERNGDEYHIKTKDGDFYVMDFIDIRYDFLDDRVRTLKGTEHVMFSRQIHILRNINSLLKELAWS